MAKANSEAATYRTRLREVEERLAGAKTVDEFEAAVADERARTAELETSLLRERVARKHRLPDDLTDRLRGATEDELIADAKALARYAVTETVPDDLSGGLDPNGDDDFDPIAVARAARAARY